MTNQQWARVCREPDCWWCGPPRKTFEEAADDLEDHMEQHNREDER